MGAIHSKIKKIRMQSGITQQETADKLHMHLNTWQKIENGVTKLDIDRLKDIAEIFETSVEELINVDDNVTVNSHNEIGGDNNGTGAGAAAVGYIKEVIVNNCSENERELYERMLREKDETIAFLKKIVEGKG
jgi:transcriptional regulator with XRE-family HTH domain